MKHAFFLNNDRTTPDIKSINSIIKNKKTYLFGITSTFFIKKYTTKKNIREIANKT